MQNLNLDKLTELDVAKIIGGVITDYDAGLNGAVGKGRGGDIGTTTDNPIF